MCDDVQLRNRCVCEFLILARTWFAFGLPSKTGCDIIVLQRSLDVNVYIIALILHSLIYKCVLHVSISCP
jgi:hypothetical protein